MTDARLPKDATVGLVCWPDWRHDEAYHYAGRLPRTAWAREFLRRNPQFQRDHAKSVPPAYIVRTRADTKRIELTTRSSFLRLWLDATSARVFGIRATAPVFYERPRSRLGLTTILNRLIFLRSHAARTSCWQLPVCSTCC
ncbi:transcriptional regulator domain-containing protein [Mesorhizobium caraganae]|uniref:transcriptional regulator domain-containing protein n=1 Tax=Mesorhizobium caraganae TaxID=483206 RepID=UPI0035E3CA18